MKTRTYFLSPTNGTGFDGRPLGTYEYVHKGKAKLEPTGKNRTAVITNVSRAGVFTTKEPHFLAVGDIIVFGGVFSDVGSASVNGIVFQVDYLPDNEPTKFMVDFIDRGVMFQNYTGGGVMTKLNNRSIGVFVAGNNFGPLFTLKGYVIVDSDTKPKLREGDELSFRRVAGKNISNTQTGIFFNFKKWSVCRQ